VPIRCRTPLTEERGRTCGEFDSLAMWKAIYEHKWSLHERLRVLIMFDIFLIIPNLYISGTAH
jgi:hypothetical protein